MKFKFLAGHNDTELLETIKHIKHHWLPIIDYAKEESKSLDDSIRYISKLKNTIDYLNYNNAGDLTCALKLSSFSNEYFMDDTIDFMLDRNIKKILLDAEQDAYKEREYKVYQRLLEKYNRDHVLLYKTYQMYRQDSYEELKNDMHIHKNLGIKLVRGAYYHQDYKSGKLYQDIIYTHSNYNRAIKHVINNMHMNNNRLLIATHNVRSINLAMLEIKNNDLKDRIYFAQLLGMNNKIGYEIVKAGFKNYKYLPYGNFYETYPYLIRRLYENYDILKYIL